ncbi:Benzoate carboxyl methyltransferase [Heracleum sosnowskyi]|uniref:Benzoate carboxyl methyltransferase n=1 Tax=Heracleum sosnowskyi TaxID=360622 RepID=A0AAD8IS22_9APIA|nr:Benzoate carboxyl methyltransferase [Heracleum sosnowskyi]
MAQKNVLHMNAGAGESSYAKNSSFQKASLLRSIKVLEDSVDGFGIDGFPQCFRLADLGCASGPNSLLVVTTIIDNVRALCQQKDLTVPEFQVFLNDLPDNDFNTIFKIVKPSYSSLANGKGDTLGDNCFISGVPGSFYTRLFPSRSIHFVHSSNSVHWLSQVPVNLEKNRGNIYMAKASPPGICEAYFDQYTKDFSTFLSLRSLEIAPKGCMVITFQGRSRADPSNNGCSILYEILAKSLQAMSTKGFINEADIDSFNIPFYNPTTGEVKAIIDAEGSFEMQEMQTFKNDIEVQSTNKDIFCRIVAKQIRVINEPMLAAHFGETFMDKLFDKYAEELAEHLSKDKIEHLDIMISLTRKSD